MKIFWRTLFACLVLVVVLVAGTMVYVSQLDPARLKELIAHEVRNATGRDLGIAGGLRLTLFPQIAAEVSDVSFSNAPWASRDSMVRVEQARAELAWLPLLTGHIGFNRIVMTKPDISLETDAKGRGNWDFARADEGPTPAAQSSGSSRPISLRLSSVHIENATIRYLDGTTGKTTNMRVDELDITEPLLGQSVAVRLHGAYQGLGVSLDGSVGGPNRILDDEDISVDLSGSFGDARLSVQGTAERPLSAAGLNLAIAVETPATKPFTELAGIDFENIGPLKGKARLTDKDGRYRLDDIELTARGLGADLTASGSVASLVTVPDPDLRLKASAQSTKRLTDLAGVDIEDMGPVNVETRLIRRDGHFDLVDLRMTGRGLGADVRAEGSVGRLDAGPTPDLRLQVSAATTDQLTKLAGLDMESMGPVNLTARLVGEGGHFHIEDMNATGSGLGADASARGSIRDLDTTPRPDLALELSAPSTVQLAEFAKVKVRDLGPVKFQGRLVSKDASLDLEAIELTAHARDAHLSLRGSVTRLRDKPKPDVVLTLTAKSLHELMEDLPEVGPVDVSARVEPRGSVIEIRQLEAKVGKSDLSGALTIDIAGERPTVSGKLHSRVLHLDELIARSPSAEKKAPGAASGEKRLFSADPIPLDGLAAGNANVQLTAGHVAAHRFVMDDVSIAVKLENRKLTANPKFKFAGGSVEGAVGVDGANSPVKYSMRLDGKAVQLGQVSEEIRGEGLVKDAPMNFRVNVKGEGDSVRAIMADLDGRIGVDIGKGELRSDRINLAGGDVFSQLLGSVIPDDHEGTDIMECGVVRFAIQDGFAVADRTLVLETNKVLVKGGGAVDLASEQLSLGARIAARSGLRIGVGSLANMVQLQGTLADPGLGVSLSGVVTAGAKVTGAVFTMGLSLLAENLYGELLGDPHPCKTALAVELEPRARGEGGILSIPGAGSMKKGVDDVTKSTDTVVEDTAKDSGGLLKNIGDGFKELFK